MTTWNLVVLGLIVLGLALPRLRRGRALQPEAQIRVEVDDREIRCTFPAGDVHRAAWGDITKVCIQTTSDGPWSADVFWGIHAGDERRPVVLYPQGATGDQAALAALQRRLPGFDDAEVIRAMGCTSDRRFVVWTATPTVTAR